MTERFHGMIRGGRALILFNAAVFQYCSHLRIGFVRLYNMLLEPVMEIRFCRVVTLRDEPLRRAV